MESIKISELRDEAKRLGLRKSELIDLLKKLEFYWSAVKKNGNDLEIVPENLKTSELCKLAIEEDGYTFIFIPENFKTPELCKLAVEDYGSTLKFVP